MLPGVEVVPAFTFRDCINLEIVISMNNDVKRLEEGCFYLCLLLVSISFSRNLQFIGRRVFYCCYSLNSVDIPFDVLAFDRCEQLIIIDGSNSVTANDESTTETLDKDVEIIIVDELDVESTHKHNITDEEESSTESKRQSR